MFELRCFLEDKHLSKVMWALDGLVVGMPQVLPVRGAVAKKGKVQSTGEGNITEKFLKAVGAWHHSEYISTKTLGKMLTEAGSQQTGSVVSQTAVRLAKNAGLIRPSKTRGTWLIKKESV